MNFSVDYNVVAVKFKNSQVYKSVGVFWQFDPGDRL